MPGILTWEVKKPQDPGRVASALSLWLSLLALTHHPRRELKEGAADEHLPPCQDVRAGFCPLQQTSENKEGKAQRTSSHLPVWFCSRLSVLHSRG